MFLKLQKKRRFSKLNLCGLMVRSRFIRTYPGAYRPECHSIRAKEIERQRYKERQTDPSIGCDGLGGADSAFL